MIEIINLSELSNLFGGGTDFCSRMQEMASKNRDNWTNADWDKWADAYEAACMN